MNEIALMREIAKLQGQIDSLRTIEVGGVWQDWTPTFPAGTMALTGATISYAKYCVIGNAVLITTSFNGTLSGTAANSFLVAFPFSVYIQETPIFMSSHSTSWGNKGIVVANGINLQILSEDYSNQSLGTQYFRINCFGLIN